MVVSPVRPKAGGPRGQAPESASASHSSARFELPPGGAARSFDATHFSASPEVLHPAWGPVFEERPYFREADRLSLTFLGALADGVRATPANDVTVYFGAGTDGGRAAAFGAPLTIGVDARQVLPTGVLPDPSFEVRYMPAPPDMTGWKRLDKVAASGHLREVLAGFARYVPYFRPLELTFFHQGVLEKDAHGLLRQDEPAVHFRLRFDEGPGTPEREYVHLTALIPEAGAPSHSSSANYVLEQLHALNEARVGTVLFKASRGISTVPSIQALTTGWAASGAVVVEGQADGGGGWEFSGQTPRAHAVTTGNVAFPSVPAPGPTIWGYQGGVMLWTGGTPGVRDTFEAGR